MITRNQIVTLASLVILMSSSAALSSEGRQGDFELGLYGGYAQLDSYAPANLDNGFLGGARLGYFLTDQFSTELSFHRIFTDLAVGPSMEIDSTRLNVLWNFLPGSRFRPFLTAGPGWDRSAFPGNTQNDLSINAGAGLRWFLFPTFGLRLDARYVTVSVSGAGRQHNFEYTGGFFAAFGGGAKKPKDGDGDGVPDNRDRCPSTASGANVDPRGCRKVVDSDQDGIRDSKDQCLNTPSDVQVDASGCAIMEDADGDRVPDEKDRCPNSRAGVSVNAQGCPRDVDKDGVADVNDICPNTLKGTQVDKKGCPLKSKARGILHDVNFGSGSTRLTSPARQLLQNVAVELRKYPKVRVEVQGHTDSTGSAGANYALSEGRAKAVVDYLISRGVPKKQLRYRGYGETRPIATNKTRQGRNQNRRVELEWLD